MATRIIRGTQTVTDYNQAGETALAATITGTGTTLANNFVIYNTDIPAIRIWNGTAFQNLTQPTIDDIPVLNNIRTTPVRVAVFGDSTANYNGNAGQDQTVLTAPFPTTGNTTQITISGDRMTVQSFYPVAYNVANGGISGQTTAQMLARDSLAASSTRKAITDVIDLKTDVVFLKGGSINDISTVTSGTLAATIAATYANHILIIERFLSAGIPVVDEGFYGYSGSGATDVASTKSAIVQLNAMYKTFAQTYPGRVFFIDFLNLLSDSTGTYLANVTTDGTHLSTQGAHITGRAEAIVLTSLFGKSATRRFQGINLQTNTLFSNTSTSGIGVQAAGYSLGASSATLANAKIEIIDGRVWQTVEMTNTSAGSFNAIYLPWSPASLGIIAGDVYGIEFDFYAANLVGGPPPAPLYINARVTTVKNGAGTLSFDALQPSIPIPFNEAYIGHATVGPFQMPESSSNLLNTGSTIFFAYTTNALTSYKIGISMPRIVKLGNTDVPTSFLTSGSVPVAISSGGTKAGILTDNGDVIKQTYLSGAIAQLTGVLYTQNVSTTVTNTVTETTILGAGLGYGRTLPANFFNVTGKTVRLRIGGIYSTPAASTPSLIIKIKYGSVVVATITTSGLLAGAINLRFDGEIFLTCQSTGATGTLVSHGDIQYAAGLAGQVLFDPLNNAGAAATINTTTANLLDITVQWDAATATRSATSTVAVLEVLN